VTLRVRIAVAATFAAAIAAVGVAVFGVVNTRHQLRSQADASLLVQARALVSRQAASYPSGHDGGAQPSHHDADDANPANVLLDAAPYRVIDSHGTVLQGDTFGQALSVDGSDLAIAEGRSGAALRDAYVSGVHYRIVTVPAGKGMALQSLRPMGDIDRTVRNTTVGFALIGIAGVAIAAGLGVLVARSALVPVVRLSEAVDRVAGNLDLQATVPETGGAELSRLGRSFNTALSALDASRRQQRRLIEDAAHELRTPLTSLRTNVEVLSQLERLDAGERASLLADLSSQFEELTSLVADLGMLSRQDAAEVQDRAEVRLDRVVAAAIERARRRAPAGTSIVADLEPSVITAVPALLERAILNVLDNAVKWGPPGEPITVVLTGGELTVADRGPGVPESERALVFERFWRSPNARSQRGSGLGLAIVRQVVSAHAGTVRLDENPGGGTLVRLTLPAVAVAQPRPEPAPTLS
jgi:two-component system sensor histidine kinase MprB